MRNENESLPPSMPQLSVAIILPAFNEALTIQKTIEDFHSVMPSARIYVIDNASSDGTGQIAESTFSRLNCGGKLLVELRKGKANALRKAFHEINADIYVMADGDSTYLAEDLPKLLEPVKNGHADLVIGNRHANSHYRKQNQRRFHNFGNGLVGSLINLLFRRNLHDVMSGYRVLSHKFVKNFPVLSEGFEIETEMTLHAVDKRFAIQEIPISYLQRPAGSFSKLSTFKDGFRVLKVIFWIFKDFRPLIFFSALCILSVLLSVTLSLPVILHYMQTGLVPRFPTAILATGLMVFALLFLAIGLILDTVAKYQRAQFELRLLANYPNSFRNEKNGASAE